MLHPTLIIKFINLSNCQLLRNALRLKMPKTNMLCFNCGLKIGESNFSNETYKERTKNLPIFCSIVCSTAFTFRERELKNAKNN